MNAATAIKRLGAAKRTIRHCKKHGITEPPEQMDLTSRTEKEKAQIEAIAEQNQYAEPWASYIAPYQYDLKQSLQ